MHIESLKSVICIHRRCLPPFPFANDPPAPPPPERVQEILNDPRVIAQQARAEN
jgi:hypothetical protein